MDIQENEQSDTLVVAGPGPGIEANAEPDNVSLTRDAPALVAWRGYLDALQRGHGKERSMALSGATPYTLSDMRAIPEMRQLELNAIQVGYIGDAVGHGQRYAKSRVPTRLARLDHLADHAKDERVQVVAAGKLLEAAGAMPQRGGGDDAINLTASQVSVQVLNLTVQQLAALAQSADDRNP